MTKELGQPLAEGLESAIDLPHTISHALMYNQRLQSFNELPKDKRPPRKMWDRPYELGQYLEHVWDRDKDDNDGRYRSSTTYEYNPEDVE